MKAIRLWLCRKDHVGNSAQPAKLRKVRRLSHLCIVWQELDSTAFSSLGAISLGWYWRDKFLHSDVEEAQVRSPGWN